MEFGKTLRSDSVGFLYFSGHGLQVAGENCLVPIDAPGIRTMDLVSATRVLACVENAQPRLNIFWFWTRAGMIRFAAGVGRLRAASRRWRRTAIR